MSASKAANQTALMGTDSIPSLLWRFGLPAATAATINGLYNVVDSIFVGIGVGEKALAATTVAFPSVLLMVALGVLVGAGGNALMALKLGEKENETAEKVMGNSLTLMIIIAAAVSILGLIFLDPLLRLSGATDEIFSMSKTYTGILLGGMITQSLGFSMNNFIRTTGAPIRAMVTIAVGALINATLDYVFIFLLGWGIAGAAWATIIAQGVSSIMVLQYFLGKKSPVYLGWKTMKLEWPIVVEILKLGTSSFIMQSAGLLLSIVVNLSLKYYGFQSPLGSAGALAAMGVVTRIAQFILFPIIGFVMAVQPIIGYNYGAKSFDRVKKTFWVSSGIVTGILVLMWIGIELTPGIIVGFFGIEEESIRNFTAMALRIDLFAAPVIGFQMIASNYFQATGQPFRSSMLTLSRQVLFLLPLTVAGPYVFKLLGFSPTTVLLGIPLAMPISDTLAFILAAFMMKKELKVLDEKHAQQIEYEMIAESGYIEEMIV